MNGFGPFGGETFPDFIWPLDNYVNVIFFVCDLIYEQVRVAHWAFWYSLSWAMHGLQYS